MLSGGRYEGVGPGINTHSCWFPDCQATEAPKGTEMEEVDVTIKSEDATAEELRELANRLQEHALQVLDAGYFRTQSGHYVKVAVSVE